MSSKKTSKKTAGFYLKGIRPNGDICIFDGCHNPYDISLDNPPNGHSYANAKTAIETKSAIKNPFVKIEWHIISRKDFIDLKIKWCKDYIKHYEHICKESKEDL